MGISLFDTDRLSVAPSEILNIFDICNEPQPPHKLKFHE
ncbi:hypothetical protein VIC_001520 [Vibrio coralliilyticus ATCC BAA-450]|nr:hypothetical protein VIC_001520 [Vibrio coralliilyticus ATCC BAA-450]